MKKSMIVMLILAAFLAGCAPGQSPEAIQAQVNTAVAQTMEAQQQIIDSVAATVAAQSPAFTATAQSVPTLEFTPTSIPAIPTSVVIPIDTPTAVVLPPVYNGGSSVSTQAQYSCDVINTRPFDLTEIHHGDKFDIKWTIVNKGTRTWDAGMDVKYFSGPKMTTTTLVQIPVKMEPNDTYQIVLDAVAPATLGRQVMTWTVQGQLCYPYVAIIVK